MKYVAISLSVLLTASTPALAELSIPPILAASTAASSATPTAQSSWVVSGSHAFLGFTVVAPSAGYVLAWDATSVPADGSVTPAGCFPIQAPISGGPNSFTSMANTPTGVLVQNGIALAFSTGADCFHKVSANAFISINYQP